MNFPWNRDSELQAARAEAALEAAGAFRQPPREREHDRRVTAGYDRWLAKHRSAPRARQRAREPDAEPRGRCPDGASARRAAAEAADELITALADAGMSADRIDVVAEDVLGGRYDQPTAVSERFYAEFDRTAATYVAELRELEAG